MHQSITPSPPIQQALKELGLDPRYHPVRSLQPDGSLRRFVRIGGSQTPCSVVLMMNPPRDEASRRENLAYLAIGRHLEGLGLPLPRILAHDLGAGHFLLEDLGDLHLLEAVRQGQDPLPLYEQALEILLRLQVKGIQGLDLRWCCQTRQYDRVVMRRYEAHYFRDAFLTKYLGLKGPWVALEVSFEHLCTRIASREHRFFMHRDFQSRNIMVRTDGTLAILDWQGGRQGPLGYDLASFVMDPYADLPSFTRGRLLETYFHLLESLCPGLSEEVAELYPYLAIQRHLQILGAFAFLSMKRGKTWFRAHIPAALKGLNAILGNMADPELDPLRDVVEGIGPLVGPLVARSTEDLDKKVGLD